MATTPFRFSDGSVREGKTRFRTGAAAPRHADVITANTGESLGSITERAYGINTPGNRAKIVGANATLDGEIIVPRG